MKDTMKVLKETYNNKKKMLVVMMCLVLIGSTLIAYCQNRADKSTKPHDVNCTETQCVKAQPVVTSPTDQKIVLGYPLQQVIGLIIAIVAQTIYVILLFWWWYKCDPDTFMRRLVISSFIILIVDYNAVKFMAGPLEGPTKPTIVILAVLVVVYCFLKWYGDRKKPSG